MLMSSRECVQWPALGGHSARYRPVRSNSDLPTLHTMLWHLDIPSEQN